jgi:quinol monooxygenase YgiN
MGLCFSGLQTSSGGSFGAKTPFILLARCHVKPDRLEEYLMAAEVADAAVKKSEPGMLHHTFDSDPTDPYAFVWSELYKDDASLLFHLANPPLVKFVEQHGELGDDFSIEVYGTLADDTKKAFSAAGFPIKYFDTKVGYSRIDTMSLQTSSLVFFGANTPFILIARCHVKPDRLEEYLKAAKVADAAVKKSEPGMLHHTFDSDPTDPYAFVWSEVYKDDASLLTHLTNPPLVKFVEQHGELGDDFSIEVYGTLDADIKKAFSAAGFPIKYFDTKFGYSRVGVSTPSSFGGA